MLNHSFISVLRTSMFKGPQTVLPLSSAADDASRRFSYDNIKIRKLRYKSTAREKRKAIIRARAGGMLTPRDTGEEQPPFFMPARYKLLVKCYQEFRNSNRFSRKPMPEAVRVEFARRSKEYQMYKHYEVQQLEREGALHLQSQLSALEACLFLPDYLMEETLTESGAAYSEAMEEFMPGVLYIEQILRIFPKEYTNRLRMIPAWEETLMKYNESTGDAKGSS